MKAMTKKKSMKDGINEWLIRIKMLGNSMDKQEIEAFGIIEIILILVIILGLVVIFKGEIETIVNDAIDSIKGKAGKIV